MEYDEIIYNASVQTAAFEEQADMSAIMQEGESHVQETEATVAIRGNSLPEHFRTYSELEFTRVCIKTNLSHSTILDWLHLMADEKFDPKDVKYATPQAVIAPVNESAAAEQKFEAHVLDGYGAPIKVYRRNGLNLAKRIIGNKRYADMIFSPAGGHDEVGVFSGIKTGTWWLEQRQRMQAMKLNLQSKGQDCDEVFLCPIMVSADATNITFSGSKKAHNVFMSFALMSLEDRRHMDW
jgi:hypothetical protein